MHVHSDCSITNRCSRSVACLIQYRCSTSIGHKLYSGSCVSDKHATSLAPTGLACLAPASTSEHHVPNLPHPWGSHVLAGSQYPNELVYRTAVSLSWQTCCATLQFLHWPQRLFVFMPGINGHNVKPRRPPHQVQKVLTIGLLLALWNTPQARLPPPWAPHKLKACVCTAIVLSPTGVLVQLPACFSHAASQALGTSFFQVHA